MKFDIYINNKGFTTLGVEKEIDGSNHRWLFMPSDIIPKELEEDTEFIEKYNEVFTKEVKEKYKEYLESLRPSLEEQIKQARESKKDEINRECEKAIVSGFKSNALGVEHTYQSDRDDQTNLMGLVVDNQDDLLKCFDGEKWGYVPHSVEKLRQVFNDGKQFKKDCLIKAGTLKYMLENATTLEEIESISW